MGPIKLLRCNFVIAHGATCVDAKPTLSRHAVNEFMLKSSLCFLFSSRIECENRRRVTTFLNCSSRF